MIGHNSEQRRGIQTWMEEEEEEEEAEEDEEEEEEEVRNLSPTGHMSW